MQSLTVYLQQCLLSCDVILPALMLSVLSIVNSLLNETVQWRHLLEKADSDFLNRIWKKICDRFHIPNIRMFQFDLTHEMISLYLSKRQTFLNVYLNNLKKW